MSLVMWIVLTVAAVSFASLRLADTAGRPAQWRVYLGTATRKQSKGIYLAQLDLATARLSEPTLIAEAASPGFLAVHPNRQWMYSVGQYEADGEKTGGVYAFAIDDATGKLARLNTQPSGGQGPCHVSVDPTGQCVLVANYSSGSVAALPIESDGKLGAPACVVEHTGSGADPRRQDAPHAHAIQPHPSEPFAFAADLGTDQLLVYRFDAAAARLEPLQGAAVDTAPGAGPRHFAFHATLDTIYVINELDSTVLVLRFDAGAGRCVPLQTITTLPEQVRGEQNYPSEVAVHPSGQFLYGANRGHDSLAVFRIDPTTGMLEPIADVDIEGQFPRHFAIDPTGQVLIAAHQNSNNLAVFRIDATTGVPQFTGQHVDLESPMCVLYM